MAQDTGKKRKNLKDQYYTNPSVAAACVQTIQEFLPNCASYEWLEPSAGTGTFLEAAPPGIQKQGLDIDPKKPDIQRADFLTWFPVITARRTLVFGNPPFGSQGTLARAFLKKAAEFADCIAFILPRSFSKPSMYSALPLCFHLLITKELPPNSFLVNNQPYDVPCVFQIWKREPTPRPAEVKIPEKGFNYVKANQDHHLVMKRVGVSAGNCVLPHSEQNPSPNSHYFLCFQPQLLPRLLEIQKRINAHTFPSNTTGPRSLSKSEVNLVLNRILEDSNR